MRELLTKLRLKVHELEVLSGLNDPPRQETYAANLNAIRVYILYFCFNAYDIHV